MSIIKVISGGQTGADQAGLLAAKACNIETGGTAPDNFYTDIGPNYLLAAFGLVAQGNYRSRTIKNVKDADGTVLLSLTLQSPGSILTRNESKRQGKPYLEFDITDPMVYFMSGAEGLSQYLAARQAIAKSIVDWAEHHHISILNVAGNREKTNAGSSTHLVLDVLTHTFKLMR